MSEHVRVKELEGTIKSCLMFFTYLDGMMYTTDERTFAIDPKFDDDLFIAIVKSCTSVLNSSDHTT